MLDTKRSQWATGALQGQKLVELRRGQLLGPLGLALDPGEELRLKLLQGQAPRSFMGWWGLVALQAKEQALQRQLAQLADGQTQGAGTGADGGVAQTPPAVH